VPRREAPIRFAALALLALIALAGGCSLVSEVDELAFDGTDADSDSDSDGDTDVDSDTDFPGTCLNPHWVTEIPYYIEGTTAGQPDQFFNTCQAECCAGFGETVYVFYPPYDGTFTVTASPMVSPGALLVGVQENNCADGEWCTASGYSDDIAPAEVGFYASMMYAYFIIVEGIGGDVPYYLSLYESGVLEDGTCEYPYNVTSMPWTGYGDTSVQPNNFTQVCGSECCDSGDAVFLFQPPEPGDYAITLFNESSTGGGGFAVAVLDACADDYSCVANDSGAAMFGDYLQVPLSVSGASMYFFIVVQGMADGGAFSLTVEAGGTLSDGGVSTDG